MSISVKTRKILWGRSGNICAYPGCHMSLVWSHDGTRLGVVVGVEAHIVSKRRDGPRGSYEPPGGDHDGYLNLILLCGNHHTMVDDLPDHYPVLTLTDMKAAHEQRIALQVATESRLSNVPISEYEGLCANSHPVNAWRIGGALVVACSHGSAPVMVSEDSWRGSGLEFKLVSTRGIQRLFESSEANFDIKYWVHNTNIHIVQHTYDPESNDVVPFVEHQIDVSTNPVYQTSTLLLRPSKSTEQLQDILEILRDPTRKNQHSIERTLYRLRNVGLSNTEKVLTLLKALEGSWWHDGAFSETATSVTEELNLVFSCVNSE